MKKITTYAISKAEQEAINIVKKAEKSKSTVRGMARQICDDHLHQHTICECCPMEHICETGTNDIPISNLIDFLETLPKE